MHMAQLTLEQGRFRLDRLTRALSWLLPTTAILMVLTIGTVEVGLPPAIAGLFAVLLLAAFPVCAIMVAIWFHRANANLHDAGIAMNHGPHMAWIWFLVPIANLFKPYQVLREIWVDSHRLADSFAAPSPSQLGLWWGGWIVSTVLFRIADTLTLGGGAKGVAVIVTVAALAAFSASTLALRTLIREVNTAQHGLADAAVFA
ncbi:MULTISPECIES: DUF4328 domain-containing protein [unclassified Sphingomonas]|uniref:DUF4328 domain-containing protein n=2 Tax=Novosphingobium TaxID=165696 RepID=UPI0015CB5558